MTVKTKKYILKAAKDSVNQKFTEQVDNLLEQINAVTNTEGHLDEDGNYTHDPEAECAICNEAVEMRLKLRAVESEWQEWSDRAKKNKKKVGKRVAWTNQREHAPMRTVNNAALDELRKTRKEKAKAHVGVAWLYEGALVTKRGKTDMMIVTRIAGNTVECLKDGTTQWFRNVALRPADWMMED